MLAPLAKGAAVGLVGAHTVVAPAGNPLIAQVAAAAALGPLLVQVMVPLTAAPAVTTVGNVLPVTAISASARTVAVYGVVLLVGFVSAVAEPAVTVADTEPLSGAT
jgi:hypothetical protein